MVGNNVHTDEVVEAAKRHEDAGIGEDAPADHLRLSEEANNLLERVTEVVKKHIVTRHMSHYTKVARTMIVADAECTSAAGLHVSLGAPFSYALCREVHELVQESESVAEFR